jgi:hypothetical protein
MHTRVDTWKRSREPVTVSSIKYTHLYTYLYIYIYIYIYTHTWSFVTALPWSTMSCFWPWPLIWIRFDHVRGLCGVCISQSWLCVQAKHLSLLYCLHASVHSAHQHTHGCIYIYIYIYIYIHTHTQLYCLHAPVRSAHQHTHGCIHTYIYIYTHTYSENFHFS